MFKELYYWMFWYVKKIRTESDREKARSAYILISGFQSMNIGTVFIITNFYLNIVVGTNMAIYAGLFLMLILLAINHISLFANREMIFQKYEHKTPTRRRRGKLFFWFYIVISIFLMFYLGSNLIEPRY